MLLDLHLPRKSGFEVLEWIRSQPSYSKLVVFILSSSPLREDFDRSMLLGADAYFVKPVGLEGLRDMVGLMITRWGHIYSGLNF